MSNFNFDRLLDKTSLFLEKTDSFFADEEKAAATVTSVASLLVLNRARKARKRGDWPQAIYWMVYWVGINNNYAHQKTQRLMARLQGVKPSTMNR